MSNNIDQNIRELFQDKLGESQMPVDPSVWNGVQANLPSGAGAVSGAGAGSGGWASLSQGLKWLIGLGGSGLVITAAVIGLTLSDNEVSNETAAVPETEMVENSSDTETIADQANVVEEDSDSSDESTSPITEESSNSENVQIPGSDQTETVSIDSSSDYEETGDTPKSYEIARGAPQQESASTSNQTVVSETSEEVAENTPEITASFSAAKDEYDDLSYTFTAEFDGEATYKWEIGDEMASARTVYYSFMDEKEHAVRLTVTDANGEFVTHEMVLDVFKTPYVHEVNVFTPNGDASNPYFDLEGGESVNITIVNLTIFNRNQQVVFQSSNNRKVWDGTDQFGNDCEEGTYHYVYEALTKDGKSKTGGSALTLLRR